MTISLNKFGIRYFDERLANGTRLVFFEKKGAPIHILASFIAGSRFDVIPGTAHFLEHMILAGTENFPSKNLIAEYIHKVGGDFGGVTNSDLFNLWIEIPEAEDILVGINVLNEFLNKPIFDPQKIETERGAILTEIKDKESNPRAYLAEVRKKLLMQGTSLSSSNLGEEENVKKISKDDLREHSRNFLTADRLCFVVCGDVDFQKLKSALEQIDLPRGNKFLSQGQLPIYKEKTFEVEIYKGSGHIHASIASRLEIGDFKEYCALNVVNGILALGRGSLLVTKLRYENGLIYTISSGIATSIDWGSLRIDFSCSRKNFEKVNEIIFKELDNLRTNGVSVDRLENMKSKISKGLIRNLQTSKDWVDFHAREAVFFEKVHTPDQYIECVQSLSLSDVQEAINKFLVKENFYTAVCGDY